MAALLSWQELIIVAVRKMTACPENRSIGSGCRHSVETVAIAEFLTAFRSRWPIRTFDDRKDRKSSWTGEFGTTLYRRVF